MTARFTRRRETFTCLHCERVVTGDGYTNHCPSCLWSRHVDVLPGDRAATCRGPMEPVGVLYGEREVRLAHVCVACGYVGHNRVSAQDDPAAIQQLLGRPVPDPTGPATPRSEPPQPQRPSRPPQRAQRPQQPQKRAGSR